MQDLAEMGKERLACSEASENDRCAQAFDISDFEAWRTEISEALLLAKVGFGHFQATDHSISKAFVVFEFAQWVRFFSQGIASQPQNSMFPGVIVRWEFKSRLSPLTSATDLGVSDQITLPRVTGLWPDVQAVPDFKAVLLTIEAMNLQIVSCFAEQFEFPHCALAERRDHLKPARPSSLRLLHYLPVEGAKSEDKRYWQAETQTEFDCLTLLHHHEGQSDYRFAKLHEPMRTDSGARVHSTLHRGELQSMSRLPGADLVYSGIGRFCHDLNFDDKFWPSKTNDDHQGRGRQMGNVRKPGVACLHIASHVASVRHIRIDAQGSCLGRSRLSQNQIDIGKDQTGLRLGSIRNCTVQRKSELTRRYNDPARRNAVCVSGKRRRHTLRRQAFDHRSLHHLQEISQILHCKPETKPFARKKLT